MTMTGGKTRGEERTGPDAGRGGHAETFGGQAVLEGVMMRGPRGYATAVRRPTGEIASRYRPHPRPSLRYRPLGWPLVRGVGVLVDSLVVGVESLMWSANEAAGEDEKLSGTESLLAVVLAAALAIGLFVLLPTVVVGPLSRLGASALLVNLGEGLVRLAILVLYVWAVGRLPDIKRVFEYHGAEHKVINAYEAGGSYEPAVAARFGTAHPRCGTSFLLIVVVIAVVVFSFFGWPNVWLRLATRLGLLPVVAGLAYEVIRLGGRPRSLAARALVAPGVWLQKLTTREPDEGQLEVAARALSLLEPPPAR